MGSRLSKPKMGLKMDLKNARFCLLLFLISSFQISFAQDNPQTSPTVNITPPKESPNCQPTVVDSLSCLTDSNELFYVIRNQNEWIDYCYKKNSIPAPIDFEKQMLVVLPYKTQQFGLRLGIHNACIFRDKIIIQYNSYWLSGPVQIKHHHVYGTYSTAIGVILPQSNLPIVVVNQGSAIPTSTPEFLDRILNQTEAKTKK